MMVVDIPFTSKRRDLLGKRILGILCEEFILKIESAESWTWWSVTETF